LSETIPPPETLPDRHPAFRLPADYYTAPADEVRPVFPRWMPLGCGGAALVFLVLLFIGGAWAGGGGFGSVLDWVLGKMEPELTSSYTPDVTPTQRTAFEREYAHLREGVRNNKVDLVKMQKVLQSISEASSDKKLTSDEVVKLTKQMSEASKAK
jgi:hypothetical protein